MNLSACNRRVQVRSRREFLVRSSFGFGSLALGYLMNCESATASVGSFSPPGSLAPRAPHFPAKARSVIFIFLQGGPSQVDTFDPKPELSRLDGQLVPPSLLRGMLGLAQIKAEEAKLMGSRRAFRRYGQSGLEVSDLFQNVARFADDLAIIRSCHHESVIHGPALNIIHTGTSRLGHPSMGAWVLYGLGSETQNLPSYIVMADSFMRNGKAVIGPGFLPAVYQATVLSTEGEPLENLVPPAQIDGRSQEAILGQLKSWNERHLEERPDDTSLAARISNYELAFRMQTAGPELIDLSREPEHVRQMYGMDREPTAKFGRICMLARRMVERGVRFVHLYNSDWDSHAENDRCHHGLSAHQRRNLGAARHVLSQPRCACRRPRHDNSRRNRFAGSQHLDTMHRPCGRHRPDQPDCRVCGRRRFDCAWISADADGHLCRDASPSDGRDADFRGLFYPD